MLKYSIYLENVIAETTVQGKYFSENSCYFSDKIR